MEFVTIGSPGNAADITGAPNPAGSVGYVYGIGTYEVSEDMITKYNANFGVANALVITKDSRGPNKPATSVSWNEAARFVNWLNTSQNLFAAYKFSPTGGANDNLQVWNEFLDPLDYQSSNPYRSKRATYVLPSCNEWYKAAYYDPNKPSGAGYWNYATRSDANPTPVIKGDGTGENGNNEAVYNGQFGPADEYQAGGLSGYGVMGMSGNVWEWEESSFDFTNSSGSSFRGIRGGNWADGTTNISALFRFEQGLPYDQNDSVGFRIVTLSPANGGGGAVPEPTSLTIFGLGVVGIAYRARRKAKA